MSRQIVREIDTERHGLLARLKVLDRARALLAPEPASVKKKRKPAKRQARASIDKGLTDTIMNFLKQPEILKIRVGLKATDIVDLLGKRGHMFTSKFPSRSVSGLLTVLHKNGVVHRTPKGNPRTYHYRAVVNEAPKSVPAFGGEANRGLEAGG